MALTEVNLGIVGANTAAAGPVLAALGQQARLRVIELFDPLLQAAQTEAQRLDAVYSPSLDGLLRRVQGIVIADVRWMGVEPLVRAAMLERPALVLAPVFSRFSLADLQRLKSFSDLTGTLMMPDLSWRWARSTLRFRELAASRLQAVEEMELHCQASPGSQEEFMALDWCVNIMQSECRQVQCSPDGSTITLLFRRQTARKEPVRVVLMLEADEPAAPFPLRKGIMRCRQGEAVITSESELSWSGNGGPLQTENLQSDRTACSLMLDLFGRRLVGGVVPVPDVNDLIGITAIRLASQHSQATGEYIDVKPFLISDPEL